MLRDVFQTKRSTKQVISLPATNQAYDWTQAGQDARNSNLPLSIRAELARQVKPATADEIVWSTKDKDYIG